MGAQFRALADIGTGQYLSDISLPSLTIPQTTASTARYHAPSSTGAVKTSAIPETPAEQAAQLWLGTVFPRL